MRNLAHLISPEEIQKIEAEVNKNVTMLFALGDTHFSFARSIDQKEWRQVISRLYYGAYNVKRAVTLKFDGVYSTDSSDHSKIDSVPADLENFETYKMRLKNLRDDRNLADYSHSATAQDLLYSVSDNVKLVSDFIRDAKKYLGDRGVVL